MNRPLEERAREVWRSDAAIRDEFGELENFVAYAKAAERGAVKFLGGGQVHPNAAESTRRGRW